MRKSKINAILVDFDVDKDNWSFLQGFNQHEEWVVKKRISIGTQKNWFRNFLRYLRYFTFGFKIYATRKKYSKIVAWQQFFGIVLCYFLALFHSKIDIEVVILTFIYKEKKGLIGKLYKRFVKKALSSNQLTRVVVLSSYEINYYSKIFDLPTSLFVFVPIGLDSEPKFESKKGSYFLSAGRSNRDYNFLVESFKKLPSRQLIIVSDRYKNNDLPLNVQILDSCFGNNYESLVANCFAVLISLDNDPVSSGQLVANKAFIYHKPVIATDNPGIIDYVVDGVNGFVIEKSFSSIESALAKLDDPNVYSKISDSSFKYSEMDYGKKVASLFDK